MVSPRRRLTPEQRRSELLEAAEATLYRHGATVRVEDVVAAAGAAKGTFYTCFATWDDLLEAVRARQSAAAEVRVAPAVAAASEQRWAEVLPLFAVGFIDFILGMGRLHEVLFHSAFAQTRLLPLEARPAAFIARLLRAGQAAGAYAELDPEPTAALVFAAVHETADAVAAGADRGRATAALDQLLARAVLKAPSHPEVSP